jgi:hypothetical protein
MRVKPRCAEEDASQRVWAFRTADKSTREQVPHNHPIFTRRPARCAVNDFVKPWGAFA